ncbi:hypothetical protein [uncultured Microbacterium sp.]|uniref:hypothetical protein n=1 Tax=uncultured Microbacterium sp. TaxID=191216 RepID=UPI0028DD263A|nr:hypothetical protein [uncultured Microbacterium sp.]
MNQVMGSNDRVETAEAMEVATGLLMRARARFEALEEPDEAMAGSMLVAENAATAFDPVGYQMARHRARAVDALEMLMDSMHDPASGRLEARPMAMYALVRMSIEASAMALWTIQSSKKHDRIYRSLQVAYAHLIEYADFASVVANADQAAPYVAFRDEKTERLIELKGAVRILGQRELTKPPKLWRILQAVSPTVPPGQPHRVDSPYVVWKMTSAFLHGSDHLTRDLGDFEQVTESDGVGATFVVKPSWSLLCSCVAACVMEVEKLDARVRYLATTAYGERSLLPVS